MIPSFAATRREGGPAKKYRRIKVGHVFVGAQQGLFAGQAQAVFCAVNNLETQRRIEERDPEQWVVGLNKSIAEAAKKLVFARDDNMRVFIAEHIGTKQRTTLFEYLLRFQRMKNNEADSTATP